MAVKKITKRWLFNSLGVILVILIALEFVIAFSVKDYYYGSVERIGQGSFVALTGLNIINIPEGVLSIGDTAFSYCRQLQSIEIPEGAEQIADIQHAINLITNEYNKYDWNF